MGDGGACAYGVDNRSAVQGERVCLRTNSGECTVAFHHCVRELEGGRAGAGDIRGKFSDQSVDCDSRCSAHSHGFGISDREPEDVADLVAVV